MSRLNNKETIFSSLKKITSESELSDDDVLNKSEISSHIDVELTTLQEELAELRSQVDALSNTSSQLQQGLNVDAHRIRINGDFALNTLNLPNERLLSPNGIFFSSIIRDGIYLTRTPYSNVIGGGRCYFVDDEETELKVECGFLADEHSIVLVTWSCGKKDSLVQNQEQPSTPGVEVHNRLYFTAEIKSDLEFRESEGREFEIYGAFSIREDGENTPSQRAYIDRTKDLVRVNFHDVLEHLDRDTYTRIVIHLEFNHLDDIVYNEATQSFCVYIGIQSTGTATSDGCSMTIKNAMLHTVENTSIPFTPENKDMEYTGDVNGTKPS